MAFVFIFTVILQFLVLCAAENLKQNKSRDLNKQEIQEFFKYAFDLRKKNPHVQDRETKFADEVLELFKRFFVINGGVEHLYSYNDRIKELHNLNTDKETQSLQETMHELIDVPLTNLLTRLVVADPNAPRKFLKQANEILRKGTGRWNNADVKRLFVKLFNGNPEASKKALHKLNSVAIVPLDLTEDILQIAVAFHRALFLKPYLLPSLVKELITQVGIAEKVSPKLN